MATLISPGVSVTVTDESFFIPAQATTVPLFFIATASEKVQPDGVTPAAGTYEHNVVRTITSLTQSSQLYGVPRFLTDSSGGQLHGDARNEYGLFALNNFLGLGNLAYVVRANVNLNDVLSDVRVMWDSKIQEGSAVLENLAVSFLNEYNLANAFTVSDPGFRTTVTESELLSLTTSALQDLWAFSTFATLQSDFMPDFTLSPKDVFANGYDNPPTGSFIGYTGNAAAWVAGSLGSVIATEWTPTETGSFLMAVADDFKFTTVFLNKTSLGANDAARRLAIVTALQAAINSNTDVRSETYEYNLILCPAYHEVCDEMLGLCDDIKEEALVIGDGPLDKDPDDFVTWSMSTQRRSSRNIAYYYPHVIMSNQFTGVNNYVPASTVVIRTIAYNDNVSYVWRAPAGTRRGTVTNISQLGYVSGTLGTATTFNEVSLNDGQQANLYKYFTNINPIIFKPGRGYLVFGQKTSAPDASALDRINVVRLVMYIRRALRKNTLSFLFEPNDQLTRDALKAMVDGYLSDLIHKRGLIDFATVCDASNNTPDRVDRSEMYIDVALKPTKAAEFLYIPIRIVAQGTEI